MSTEPMGTVFAIDEQDPQQSDAALFHQAQLFQGIATTLLGKPLSVYRYNESSGTLVVADTFR